MLSRLDRFGQFPNAGLSHPKTALKEHFGHRDKQEYGADDRVQTEKRYIYPIQTPPSGNPVFLCQAANNKEPSDIVGDPEAAKYPKRQ